MAPGERFEVPATAADPMIWTGRPQAFRVTVGQTAIPPLGTPDQTIRDVSLKPESLLGQAADPPTAPPPAARVTTPGLATASAAPTSRVTPVDPPAAPDVR